ncbi:MAG: hypothetical protein OXC26_21845 [Albidovulum sp.]|nr:hypothetical protein [Albidovulum sp.]
MARLYVRGGCALTTAIWLYNSYREFSGEAAGVATAESVEIAQGRSTRHIPSNGTSPPVLVAARGEIPPPYPMLEGRHRQPLPRVPGRKRGRLLSGSRDELKSSLNDLDAWLIPWRVGADTTIVVTVNPETVLVLDVRRWPGLQEVRDLDSNTGSREKVLRRAAKVLEAAPGAFATEPSIGAAYDRLEFLWNDQRLEEGDPQGDLLARQARRLSRVLDDLAMRPRAVLRTEHQMLKLQSVRRADAKTQRWLSGQPGRNTAERAGSRQRIKAPKRHETIATLENGVLRAFASMTVRATQIWLVNPGGRQKEKSNIAAHQIRARRIDKMLRERKVPEAIPPIQPNFPLRFDPRYREIWRAWIELRELSSMTELDWMWQHCTFMELLGLRAAMKLHRVHRERPNSGTLAHAPVLGAIVQPNQGRYLDSTGIRSTSGSIVNGSLQPTMYRTCCDENLLGAIADAGSGTEIWWNTQDILEVREGSVGDLPWTQADDWESRLEKWAAMVVI